MKNVSMAFAAIATLALSGCVSLPSSTEDYSHVVNSWVGSSEQKLESSWGVPSSSATLANGSTVLHYIRNDTERYGYHGLGTRGYVCYTDFYVSSLGVIYSWHYNSLSYSGNFKCGDTL